MAGRWVSPAGKSAAEVAFIPDPPRIGPWKTILGEWCNGSTTGSEPVSLGSNPSSPVFISRFSLTRRGAFGTRVRAFRGSVAALWRERCRPLERPPCCGGTRSQPGFVAASRFDLSVISHAPRGFRHSRAGLWSFPSTRAEGLSALGCGPAAGAGRGFMANPFAQGISAVSQCQRRSHPRRQKNHISPPVVASMIAIATSAP